VKLRIKLTMHYKRCCSFFLLHQIGHHLLEVNCS
jgi:hypothetical protein